MRYELGELGKTIGTQIKKERIKNNWSQAELGKKIDVVGKQISNYENSKNTVAPPIDAILSLCNAFDCELGYLIGDNDYSEGTKLETAIKSQYGLTKESLNQIKIITGTKKECLDFGYESSDYIRILNALLSSPIFLNLIKGMLDLDTRITQSKQPFENIKKQIGEERFEAAMNLYQSSTDYISDSNNSKYNAIAKDIPLIEKAIDDNRNINFEIKVARYELRELFEELVNELYPRHNSTI